MKYIYLAIYYMIVLILSCSCTKEVDSDSESSENTPVPMIIQCGTDVASLQSPVTRAYIDTEGSSSTFHVKWSLSEKINVFDGFSNNIFSLTSGAGTTQATFQGTAAKGAKSLVSLCPFQEQAIVSDLSAGVIDNVTLKWEQAATPYYSDPECTLMSALSSSQAFSFKNVNSFIEFSTVIPGCKKVRFISNGDEILAGTASINAFTGIIEASSKNGSYEVCLNNIASGSTYHLAVFPTVLKKGFTVELITDEAVYSRKYTERLELRRNNNLSLGKLSESNCQVRPIHRKLYYRIEGNVLYISATAKPGYEEREIVSDRTASKNGWYDAANKSAITKVLIEEDIYPVSYARMFDSMSGLTVIDNFEKLHSDNAESHYCMFNNCKNYQGNDFSGWDMSNSKDLRGMFYNCNVAVSLGNLSNWHVTNVTDMSYFATNCKALSSIGSLDAWNVENVTNMSAMFEGCENIISLGNLKSWNVSKVTDLSFFILNDYKISSLGDLSGWDVSNVTNMASCFCAGGHNTGRGLMTNEALAGLANWDVSKVKDFTCMFYGQGTNLTQLDLSKWNTSSVEGMSHMFADCYKLQSLDLSNWDVSKVQCLNNAFNECMALVSVGNLSKWNLVSVIDVCSMFYKCHNLSGKLDLSGCYTPNLRACSAMFSSCYKLEEIDIRNFDTRHVDGGGEDVYTSGYFYAGIEPNFTHMYYGTSILRKVTVGPNWDTSKASAENMFVNSNISSVTLAGE